MTNYNVYTAKVRTSDISIIDTDIKKQINSISIGDQPRFIAITPDGKLIYLTNSSSDLISVIDTSTNNLVDNITVGSMPMGIAFGPKLSTQDKIKIVINEIQGLIDSKILDKGQGNSIISKLESVIKHLDKSNYHQALNQLQSTLNEINNLINTGILPSDLGQNIISMLRNINSEIIIV